ncbi:MAG: GNAT family N-acetyltransferase [Phycisphaerae bacterium]|nr:GNAT family N-acetyltransferase [Phycisphaerae bacterium]
MEVGYRIRHAQPGELVALPEIERLAAERFACFGLADVFSQIVTPIGLLRERTRAGLVWVATGGNDQPVGFAVVSPLDGNAHLDELDVHPDHGRRGIGTALVETACAWARSAGYRAITLSTMQDVPWNAPFYIKLGFRILAGRELTLALRQLLESEARLGLPMKNRVLMCRSL